MDYATQRQMILDCAQKSGLSPATQARVETETRPSLALVSGESGRSRLGGCPDLDKPWPRRHERPLVFVAQLDCGALPGTLPPEMSFLPKTGLLSFFYDPWTWGDWPKEDDGGIVLHQPHSDASELLDYPKDLSSGRRLRELPLGFEVVATPPDIDPWAELPESEVSAWLDLAHRFRRPHPDHRLLGNASAVQGAVRADCPHPDSPPPRPGRTDLRAPTDEWRLLAQFSSDERVNATWGDAGAIYFCLSEADLLRGRMDRAFCLLQSG